MKDHKARQSVAPPPPTGEAIRSLVLQDIPGISPSTPTLLSALSLSASGSRGQVSPGHSAVSTRCPELL